MDLFSHQLTFDPAVELAGFLAQVPARWVVYLLFDEAGRPFQLLCVKNLRASLANRLCEQPADEKTRGIPYRQVVRKVSWRRVDSQAEADWVYAQAARELFPHAYRKLIDSWSAWYVCVDPEAKFPRYTLTDHPRWELSRTTFGPMPTRAAAERFVETVVDAFDLCRYYHILQQAPHGQACAYKQMHKCPAPCDGSVSVGMYHYLIEESIAAITSPGVADIHEKRMHQAAGGLQFELAGRIKPYVQQLRSLGSGQLEHVRPLADLRFVAVMRGSRAKSWKLMLMTPEEITLTDEFTDIAAMEPTIEQMQLRRQQLRSWSGIDLLTFIARQVMGKSGDCIFTDGSREQIELAMGQLARRKTQVQSEDEGVVQEAS